MNVIKPQQVNLYVNYSLSPQYLSRTKPKKQSKFTLKRHRRFQSVREMIFEMVVHAPTFLKIYFLIDELSLLGEEFIEVCYNSGTNIYLITNSDAGKKVQLQLHGENQTFIMESLDSKSALGGYSPDFNLIILNENFLRDSDYFVAIHEMAHAYEKVVGQQYIQQQLINLGKSRFNVLNTPYLVSPYIQADIDPEYFAASVQNYFRPDFRTKLEETDEVLFHLLDIMFFGYNPSQLNGFKHKHIPLHNNIVPEIAFRKAIC